MEGRRSRYRCMCLSVYECGGDRKGCRREEETERGERRKKEPTEGRESREGSRSQRRGNDVGEDLFVWEPV